MCDEHRAPRAPVSGTWNPNQGGCPRQRTTLLPENHGGITSSGDRGEPTRFLPGPKRNWGSRVVASEDAHERCDGGGGPTAEEARSEGHRHCGNGWACCRGGQARVPPGDVPVLVVRSGPCGKLAASARTRGGESRSSDRGFMTGCHRSRPYGPGLPRGGGQPGEGCRTPPRGKVQRSRGGFRNERNGESRSSARALLPDGDAGTAPASPSGRRSCGGVEAAVSHYASQRNNGTEDDNTSNLFSLCPSSPSPSRAVTNVAGNEPP